MLLAVYTGVSFWIPYSKLGFMEDIMQNQARLFFANQSIEYVRRILTEKAEALEISLRDENISVENINGEIIYIEMSWDAPVDILFFHTSLHFEPKIFGLIHKFGTDQSNQSTSSSINNLPEFSDSTSRYLNNRNLRNYVKDFFSK
jgi:hypothetical protein